MNESTVVWFLVYYWLLHPPNVAFPLYQQIWLNPNADKRKSSDRARVWCRVMGGLSMMTWCCWYSRGWSTAARQTSVCLGHVLPQTGTMLVRFATRVTRVRPLTRVNAHVVVQRRLACKTCPTVRAPANQVSKTHAHAYIHSSYLVFCSYQQVSD